jgi:hypothetical protein
MPIGPQATRTLVRRVSGNKICFHFRRRERLQAMHD